MSLPRGSRLEGWEAGPAPVHASQPGRMYHERTINKPSEIWTED